MNRATRIVRHPDADSFLRSAEAWLLRAEAEHNLILGLAQAMREGLAQYQPPIYLATIESDTGVEGCAFRTPPFKVGLTRMPVSAIPALADDIGEVYESVPAVLGPADETLAFARAWSRLRGVRHTTNMRNRIYRLNAVADDLPHVPGALRPAVRADRDLVIAWFDAFHRESGVPGGDFIARVERRIDAGDIHLWEDGGSVVSLAGIAGRSPNGARIGPVYTPPPLRGRGYATAAVAGLSRIVLDSGRRFCFLYTDLDNPAANAIYQRIGYVPVSDVLDVTFDA